MIARIYCKTADQTRFRPLDVKRGLQVANLMHASTWWNPEEIEKSREVVLPRLKIENPLIQFELRTQGS